eukprot:GFYU01010182.1.p1 GENE.GFYU01010182.1~~GFYU01010182.1.p1  ORF type:complete len:378 (-),score=43.38 GFYU01010182.1:620-1726(-)
MFTPKTWIGASVLWVAGGSLGLHQLYFGRWLHFLTYMLTTGLDGIGWCIDLCLLPIYVFEANNKLSADTYMYLTGTRAFWITLFLHWVSMLSGQGAKEMLQEEGLRDEHTISTTCYIVQILVILCMTPFCKGALRISYWKVLQYSMAGAALTCAVYRGKFHDDGPFAEIDMPEDHFSQYEDYNAYLQQLSILALECVRMAPVLGAIYGMYLSGTVDIIGSKKNDSGFSSGLKYFLCGCFCCWVAVVACIGALVGAAQLVGMDHEHNEVVFFWKEGTKRTAKHEIWRFNYEEFLKNFENIEVDGFGSSAKRKKAMKLLGVKENATPAEIKKAYREKMMVWHPDKAADKEKAQKMSVKLNAAYELLKSKG